MAKKATTEKKRSTRSRGNEAELYVQKYHEERGYTVHRAYASAFKIGNMTQSRSHDVFGVFDLLCKKSGEPMKCIQVSTGCRKAEKEKKILALGLWNGDPYEYEEIEIWLYKGKGEWQIFTLRDGSFKERAEIRRGKVYELKEAA